MEVDFWEKKLFKTSGRQSSAEKEPFLLPIVLLKQIFSLVF